MTPSRTHALTLTAALVAATGSAIADGGTDGAPTAAQTPEGASDHERLSALLRQGGEAERELAFSRALELYREALKTAPEARRARHARARIRWLERRKEADFGPLIEWSKLSRRARTTIRLEDLRAFEERTAGFPDGQVKRDAYALIADTYFSTLDLPDDAIRAYRAWASLPGTSKGELALAASGIARAKSRLEASGDASAELERPRPGARPDAPSRRAERTVGVIRLLSWGGVGVFLVASAVWGRWRELDGRRLARAFSPMTLAVAVLLFGFPGLLYSLHDPAHAEEFWFVVGASVAALACVRLVATVRPREPLRRKLLAAAAVVATLGAGLLALGATELLVSMLAAPWQS